MRVSVDSQWHGKDVKVRGQKVVGKTAFEIGLVVEGQAKLLAPVNYGYLAVSITTQALGAIGMGGEHTSMGTEPSTPKSRSNPKGPDPGRPLRMKIASPDEPNEVWVGTPVEYAPYVEFGTVRSPAQPFLRPALDLAKGRVLTITKRNARYEFAEYLE